MRVIFAAAIATLLAATATAAPAPQADPTAANLSPPLNEDNLPADHPMWFGRPLYWNYASGKCLQVEGVWAGARVVVADCTGPTANRLWDVGPDYGWIKLNKTELCLDAGDFVGASQTNGRKLTLQTCSFFSSGHRANAQIWWYPLNRSNPWHRLELAGGSCSPQRTNKCMDLTDGNVNGGAVQLWECALGNMNQAFDLGPWCVHC